MGSRRVTLADVAKVVGVSQTTVSLVLSGRARDLRISEGVQRRVREAAAEMEYRRNRSPVGRHGARTRTIAFVSDSVSGSRVAGDVVGGALAAARRHGVTLLFGETEGDARAERTLIGTMQDHRVDGIVLAAAHTRTASVPAGLAVGAAVLLNVLPSEPSPLPRVLPDEVRGGRAAARVLLDAGHGEGIHVIGAGPDGDVPFGRTAALDRLAGVRQALGEAGVEVESGRPCRWWLPQHGFEATRELLRGERPRALVCLDDRLAFGAYQALQDAGLSVPDDVSVVSFGDHPVASWLRPGLTTVAFPHHDLGAKAVDLLLSPAEQHGADRPCGGTAHHVPMPVRGRGSVAPPR
ncbi:LacI family DNA-binding transcriptional regulator [Saccharothrix longispora]|uniref:LacI family DNA-binding transcriptional regulator n=1 Tax=Saccharothrix longispora TaxID=33920 RepID=UPI0028FD5869|nr:LacI family DNA-binding transcriptional regulator [Saccharothrix longispora]MBY8851494.1 LacI family DNA-binding transcriptional regulator [Saccharothrix sp. MB29]MDU0289913.1 LacI family DNA-binding transcriptional regulator [Saccharothrix longispora]